ncbi:unnamed protein product [Closterium sp. Naga37s-1]|nr:unnamed protein product [Closterium sp. Naga37s-1]
MCSSLIRRFLETQGAGASTTTTTTTTSSGAASLAATAGAWCSSAFATTPHFPPAPPPLPPPPAAHPPPAAAAVTVAAPRQRTAPWVGWELAAALLNDDDDNNAAVDAAVHAAVHASAFQPIPVVAAGESEWSAGDAATALPDPFGVSWDPTAAPSLGAPPSINLPTHPLAPESSPLALSCRPSSPPSSSLTRQSSIPADSLGLVTEPHSLVTEPHSLVTDPHSLVTEPHSLVTNPHSLVTDPHILVTEPHSLVTNAQGFITDPYSMPPLPPFNHALACAPASRSPFTPLATAALQDITNSSSCCVPHLPPAMLTTNPSASLPLAASSRPSSRPSSSPASLPRPPHATRPASAPGFQRALLRSYSHSHAIPALPFPPSLLKSHQRVRPSQRPYMAAPQQASINGWQAVTPTAPPSTTHVRSPAAPATPLSRPHGSAAAAGGRRGARRRVWAGRQGGPMGEGQQRAAFIDSMARYLGLPSPPALAPASARSAPFTTTTTAAAAAGAGGGGGGGGERCAADAAGR